MENFNFCAVRVIMPDNWPKAYNDTKQIIVFDI